MKKNQTFHSARGRDGGWKPLNESCLNICCKASPTVGAIICVVVSPVRVSEILATNLAGHRQRHKNTTTLALVGQWWQWLVITITGREIKIISFNKIVIFGSALSFYFSIHIYFLCSISCISISFYFSMKSNVNGQA